MLTYLLVHIDNRACFRLHGMYPTTTCSLFIKESELTAMSLYTTINKDYSIVCINSF